MPELLEERLRDRDRWVAAWETQLRDGPPRLVAEHRMAMDEAEEVALDLTYRLVKKAYKL